MMALACQSANMAESHEESLLRIPLVQLVLSDRAFQLTSRAIDANWYYEKVIPVALAGFNPYEGAFFYAQRSVFAEWLENPLSSARNHNENDCLVREVMFMVHDYLHAWTYQLVNRLWPELGLFAGEIQPERFEDFVFVHLLSEAVATVGLDYWYLCVRSINSYCPIGTALGSLTVSYRESLLPEYRRFHPELVVQDPSFLTQLARFYCHGVWTGIDINDLKRSPLLYKWLEHELSYGANQRRITRSWFRFLQGGTGATDDAPVAAHIDHAPLIEKVGKSLWRLIKDGTNDLGTESWSRGTPRRRRNHEPDFRFLNLVKWEDRLWESGKWATSEESFRYFVYQLVSRIPFDAFLSKRAGYIPWLVEQRDPSLVFDVMKSHDFLAAGDEPRDLLVLN